MNISDKDAIWFQWVLYQLTLTCEYPFNLIDENTQYKWQLVVDNIYRLYVCELIEFDCDNIRNFCKKLAHDNPFDKENLLSINTNWWSVDICLTELGWKIFDKYFYNGKFEVLNIEFIEELQSIFNRHNVSFDNKPIFDVCEQDSPLSKRGEL